MHPVTLVFNNRLFEQEYREYRIDYDLWYMRIAALTGGIIYGGYAFLDFLLYGDQYIPAATIRLGIVLPVSLICFFLSFTPDFRHTHTIQFTSIVLLLLGQLGLLLISSLPFVIPVYLSLSTMMVLVYTACMGRIFIKYQYGFIPMIMISYSAGQFFLRDNPFAVNLFEIISVNTVAVVGLVAGYIIERNDRIDFFQKKIIELQNDHLKLSNKKQNSLIQKLQYLNNDLRNFTSMASHDLKTPVRGIATLTHFLDAEIGKKASPEVKEYINLINQNIQKMEYLVAGIGKYVEAGIERNPKWTNPSKLLNHIYANLSTNSEIQISFPDEIPKLLIWEQDLRTIFTEIILNAIKHQSPSKSVKICVHQEETQDGLALSFIDNGPGIEPQYHERVFNIFETLDTEKKLQGAGIGLTIVRKILSKYQAQVSISAHENGFQGTRVRLFFPADLLYNRVNFWDGHFRKSSRIISGN